MSATYYFASRKDRNEDGSPAIENTRCAHSGCEVYLYRAGCEHLSFTCEGCARRSCSDHQVTIGGLALCPGCAAEAVESQEPECTCRQSDADLFDAVGCDYHDPNSPWNVRLRAVTAVQHYEINQKEPRANADARVEEEVNWTADQQREARLQVEGLAGAIAEMECAIGQSLPSDDRITFGLMKSAAATLRNLRLRMDAA